MKRLIPLGLLVAILSGFSVGCTGSQTGEAVEPDTYTPPPVDPGATKKEQMKQAKDKASSVEPMD